MRNWTTIKEYDEILFEQAGKVAKITINRPHVHNAFTPKTVMEMIDAFNISRDKEDVGVIILTGAGDQAFCSGGDNQLFWRNVETAFALNRFENNRRHLLRFNVRFKQAFDGVERVLR